MSAQDKVLDGAGLAVVNQIIGEWLAKKQNALTAGDNIIIEQKDGKTVISSPGGGTVNWDDINGRPDLSTVSSMVVAPITIISAAWSAEKQCVIPVDGILADENAQLIIPLPKSASEAAYSAAGVQCVSQVENALTFQADTVPTGDLSLNVYIFGAAEVMCGRI